MSLHPSFALKPSRCGCSVIGLRELETQKPPSDWRARADSDADSVVEVVDPAMSATVTQEIMSSAFVTSMFMVPSSDDEEGPHDSPAPVPAPVVPPSTPLELLEALVDGRASLELPESYWKGYDLSNSLGLGDIGSIPVGPCDTAAVPVAHLADTGYAVCQPDSLFSDSVCPALVAAVRKLTEDGWPPIFVFVFDALWVYVAKYVQASMGAILGQSCLLEPSIYCWSLSSGCKAGESFTLPHRDYPYTEAFDSAGRPSIMNVWVPLTPATLDNGCMYVLPREFDPLFDQPDHPNHLKCALPGPGQGEVRAHGLTGVPVRL